VIAAWRRGTTHATNRLPSTSARRMMPGMVEYGQGVGQATGVAGGGGGGGGQTMDAGAAIGQFVGNAVHTISTMPPTQLAILVIALVVGFVLFKRAF